MTFTPADQVLIIIIKYLSDEKSLTLEINRKVFFDLLQNIFFVDLI